ncbi:cation:proton antiporter [Candidatus Woesearchaeota archaeon]|nr:cation:proton antiporter [Candidatus Woesearchaeota archaeon]
MNLIGTIIIILLAAYLFTSLGRKIRIPIVVSLIFCGLVLDMPAVKGLVIEPNTGFIFGLGDIALLCLMFLAGLESSWRGIYKERKDAILIAFFAALVPFLAGFVAFMMMGFSLHISFIVGVCMSITAEATKARVLMELKKLRTKVGAAMMGAGIIDDILGFSLFILITYIFKEAYIREDMLIAGALISFLIGILVQKNVGREHTAVKSAEKVLLRVMVPFFFISIAIHFDMNSLVVNPVLLMSIIVIAIAGKMAGTFLTKPFTKFRWKQLYLIGWAMNSRGAVEMALALIAFRTKIIPLELYSSLVLMALVTTLIFPFMIMKMIRKDPKIMD